MGHTKKFCSHWHKLTPSHYIKQQWGVQQAQTIAVVPQVNVSFQALHICNSVLNRTAKTTPKKLSWAQQLCTSLSCAPTPVSTLWLVCFALRAVIHFLFRSLRGHAHTQATYHCMVYCSKFLQFGQVFSRVLQAARISTWKEYHVYEFAFKNLDARNELLPFLMNFLPRSVFITTIHASFVSESNW